MFLLFGGHAYYPNGGWYDYQGSYHAIEDALRCDNEDWDFMHVIDAVKKECVWSRGGSCYISDGTMPGTEEK